MAAQLWQWRDQCPRRAAIRLGARPASLRTSWLLSVSRASFSAGAGHAERERSGGWKLEAVEVDVGHLSVEADCFGGEREGERDGDVGLDHAEFACGDGDACLA